MRNTITRLWLAIPGSIFSDEEHDEREHFAAKVWVNTKSSKYFHPGSSWYGKTKSGRYMSEKETTLKATRWPKATLTSLARRSCPSKKPPECNSEFAVSAGKGT
jgi:hypothetical protein